MASTLSDALTGLNFSPGDTTWGVGASTLAGLAPKLINPYGSVGQNLGVGLGSVLLTALLQYQGKKEALASSLEANTIANDLMATTKTPEERVQYVKDLAAQGKDSDVLGKISTLATALTQSDKDALVASAARKDAAMQELYANIAKEQGIPFEAAPKWLEARNAAMANVSAGTVGKPGALPVDLMSKDERTLAATQRVKAADAIREAKNAIASSEDYKQYSEAKKQLSTLRELPDRNSEAGKQAMISLFNRVLNPGNQVTLNEMDVTGRSDAALTRFQNWWNGLTPDERGLKVATMSPEAMNELLGISEMVVDSLGKRFNSRVTGTVASFKSGPDPLPDAWVNVSNISPTGKLHLSSEEGAKKQQEINTLRSKAAEIMQRTDLPEQTRRAAAEKALQRVEEIQTELTDFE